ncbi:11162_t:CDS:2 [Ambispora gerdemannii]|uniref:11162_t:CDS:1 n=1 Tax=Ambispora gerdemannii TaxID=144530 RepID=A0A9N9ELD8_9GLOM|nr:11162_t:CDS:2 [Ambispora gerdemannii]
MANVHILQDINSKGYRLGSTREVELEEALRDSCITNSELNKNFKNYQKAYSEFNKIKQLSSEIDTLTFQNNQLQISNAEYEVKNIIHLKKIKSYQVMIKILKSKLALAQKDAFSIQENLSKTESENLFIKFKMGEFKQIEVELECVRSKLDHLKSETISKSVDSLACSAIIGETDKKNVIMPDSQTVSSTPEFLAEGWLTSKIDISLDDIHISFDMPLSIPKSVTSYLAQ